MRSTTRVPQDNSRSVRLRKAFSAPLPSTGQSSVHGAPCGTGASDGLRSFILGRLHDDCQTRPLPSPDMTASHRPARELPGDPARLRLVYTYGHPIEPYAFEDTLE